MVPRVGRQGRSFKGAGLYYLHDKEAATSERVAFTHTENLPTDDPQMALKWMAYTSMDAESLKRQSGVRRTGGPAEKPVWTLSLSWHPEQEPTPEDMIGALNSALARLGLQDHQVVMAGHNDEAHPHIHGIVNLIHPETGRSASADKLRFSKERLSEWAEEYEREHGKIYCEQRVENNAQREQAKQENEEFPRYKDPQLEQKELIAKLYHESETGTAFQSALAANGFTLAQGKRIVVIDADGKIHSLSRQIEGVRAKQIREKLADIELPDASEARGAIQQGQGRTKEEKINQEEQPQESAAQDEEPGLSDAPSPPPPENALQDRQLEELGDFYFRSQADREALEASLDHAYGNQENLLRSEISALEDVFNNSGRVRRFWLKLTGRLSFRAEQELDEKRQSLESILGRRCEAEQTLKNRTDVERDAIRVRHDEERKQLVQTHRKAEASPARTQPKEDPARIEVREEFRAAVRDLGTEVNNLSDVVDDTIERARQANPDNLTPEERAARGLAQGESAPSSPDSYEARRAAFMEQELNQESPIADLDLDWG